jgi:hypothetical protein
MVRGGTGFLRAGIDRAADVDYRTGGAMANERKPMFRSLVLCSVVASYVPALLTLRDVSTPIALLFYPILLPALFCSLTAGLGILVTFFLLYVGFILVLAWWSCRWPRSIWCVPPIFFVWSFVQGQGLLALLRGIDAIGHS